jgi:hypothetical protein
MIGQAGLKPTLQAMIRPASARFERASGGDATELRRGEPRDFVDQLWPALILWQILQSALVVRWGNP